MQRVVSTTPYSILLIVSIYTIYSMFTWQGLHVFRFSESWQTELDKAAAKVNSVETEQGMLTALTAGVGAACKCLTLFTPGHPLKPQEEEPENLTYAVRARVFCFVVIWGERYW